MSKKAEDFRGRSLLWQAALAVALLTVGGLAKHFYLLFFMVCLIFSRCIFLSREGIGCLRQMRRERNAAFRQDLEYTVSRGQVIGYTLMSASPFYCFWLLMGLFGLAVGVDGWLVTAFPTILLSCVAFKGVSDIWWDLGERRIKFWGLQGAIYAACVLPTLIGALI
ncbi:MAG: hypothetical protein E7620_02770 [Ruminococcaceae bacterium]|nr:hypothetical protein [Oscillospiraceae bacterium]